MSKAKEELVKQTPADEETMKAVPAPEAEQAPAAPEAPEAEAAPEAAEAPAAPEAPEVAIATGNVAGATLSETRPTDHNPEIHDAIAENDPPLPSDTGNVVRRGTSQKPNALWDRLNDLARANRIRPGMNLKFGKNEFLVILDNEDYVFSPVAGLTLDSTYSADKMTMPVKPGGHVSIQE